MQWVLAWVVARALVASVSSQQQAAPVEAAAASRAPGAASTKKVVHEVPHGCWSSPGVSAV